MTGLTGRAYSRRNWWGRFTHPEIKGWEYWWSLGWNWHGKREARVRWWASLTPSNFNHPVGGLHAYGDNEYGLSVGWGGGGGDPAWDVGIEFKATGRFGAIVAKLARW